MPIPIRLLTHNLVGIPGIEPGVGFPDGVTVRSRTLRGDAQYWLPLLDLN